MKLLIKITSLLSIITVSACANHVYQGKISALDSKGKERDVVLYWTKTDPLLGKAKAGPASLLTECGIPIQFTEQENGIIFRGMPGQDQRVIGKAEDEIDILCGRFNGHYKFTEISDGTVSISVYCVPVLDEFSIASQRSYINASQTPYQLPVTSKKQLSFFGKIPNAPEPPICPEE